jgi:hypothetical protein
MLGHFYTIATSVNQLDEDAMIMREARQHIPLGHYASFATNMSGDEASQGASYRSQFGWCPMILSGDVSRNDYIVFYHSSEAHDSSMAFLPHCDTLYRHSSGPYTIMLLHKLKSQ